MHIQYGHDHILKMLRLFLYSKTHKTLSFFVLYTIGIVFLVYTIWCISYIFRLISVSWLFSYNYVRTSTFSNLDDCFYSSYCVDFSPLMSLSSSSSSSSSWLHPETRSGHNSLRQNLCHCLSRKQKLLQHISYLPWTWTKKIILGNALEANMDKFHLLNSPNVCNILFPEEQQR